MHANENLDEETIHSSMRSYFLVLHVPNRGDTWAKELLLVDLYFSFKASVLLGLDRDFLI